MCCRALLSGVEDVMTLGFSSREREELSKLLTRCTEHDEARDEVGDAVAKKRESHADVVHRHSF